MRERTKPGSPESGFMYSVNSTWGPGRPREGQGLLRVEALGFSPANHGSYAWALALGPARENNGGSYSLSGFVVASDVGFSAGAAATGRSLLKISATTFHLPSGCFFQTSTNLP